MCCARRWVQSRRRLPAIPCALHSIACTNTQSGSRAPFFSPALSPCSSPRGGNLLSIRLAFRLGLFFFQGTPKVPARNRAVRTPTLPIFKDYFRFWLALEAVHTLETFSNSVVLTRQDVGPAEPRHQEHLHGPLADPAHLGEAFVDFFFAHAANFGQRRHGAIERLRRKILHRGNFLPRKAGAAQFHS